MEWVNKMVYHKITEKDFEGIKVEATLYSNYLFKKEPPEPDFLMAMLEIGQLKSKSITALTIVFDGEPSFLTWKDEQYYFFKFRPFNSNIKRDVNNCMLKLLKTVKTSYAGVGSISFDLLDQYKIAGKSFLSFNLNKIDKNIDDKYEK